MSHPVRNIASAQTSYIVHQTSYINKHQTMTREEHYQRLRQLGIRIIRMVDEMPNRISSNAIAKQVVRSGTSPAANYRAACRGKSDRDFLNKLKMVEEELDETLHWIEMIQETDMFPSNRLDNLHQECEELLKITTSSLKTMRRKIQDEI